jgi:hypothetical protein
VPESFGDESEITIDPEALLLRLNSGKKLREGELHAVTQLLQSVDAESLGRKLSVDDVYALVLVIGRAKATQCKGLLERFLDAKDPLTVGLVLEILCLQWHDTEEQLERVLNFSLGNSWDEEDDVRHIALKIIGEYLAEKLPAPTEPQRRRVKKVLELLLALFDDEELPAPTRQYAYFALLRAGGVPSSDLPSEFAILDLSPHSKQLRFDVLSGLRAMAQCAD